MTKWDARIEVFEDEKRLGWTFIKNVETEVLPRIGDRVSFWKDIASAELLKRVRLGVEAGAVVTQVEHMVGRESTEITVVIRASIAPHTTAAELEDMRTLEEGWLPAR